MIGLCGAHRTGKTTLAKAWSEATDVEFITLDVTGMMQKEGITNQGLTDDPALRLKFQRKVVDRCQEIWVGRKKPFISDRTPLDVAAYMLADAQQGRFAPDQQRQILDIVHDCIDITNVAFGGLVYVRPMFEYKPAPGKPSNDLAYQALHGQLVLGLLADQRQSRGYWMLQNLDMEKRCEELDEIWQEVLDEVLESDETDNPTRWRNV